jgi:hypothetical protein
VRKQEIVGVNRNDLDDIKEFDGMQALFANLGMFLLAGSTWLGLEKVLEQEVFHWTPLLAVCATASAVGIFFFAVGWRMRSKKIARIDRIFSETSPSATGVST